eukprot:6188938-Pleurochrysis_carterae.AAC.1
MSEPGATDFFHEDDMFTAFDGDAAVRVGENVNASSTTPATDGIRPPLVCSALICTLALSSQPPNHTSKNACALCTSYSPKPFLCCLACRYQIHARHGTLLMDQAPRQNRNTE